MRQRYLIVKDKNGNYESFISTKWMTLENQEDYEIITVCDSLVEAYELLMTLGKNEKKSITMNDIRRYIGSISANTWDLPVYVDGKPVMAMDFDYDKMQLNLTT